MSESREKEEPFVSSEEESDDDSDDSPPTDSGTHPYALNHPKRAIAGLRKYKKPANDQKGANGGRKDSQRSSSGATGSKRNDDDVVDHRNQGQASIVGGSSQATANRDIQRVDVDNEKTDNKEDMPLIEGSSSGTGVANRARERDVADSPNDDSSSGVDQNESTTTEGSTLGNDSESQLEYLDAVTPKEIGMIVFRIILSVSSIVLDYCAIAFNFKYNSSLSALLTLEMVFLVLPCIINFTFSTRWYYNEGKGRSKRHEDYGNRDPNCKNCPNYLQPKQYTVAFVLRHLASLVNLGHIARKIDVIRYSILQNRASKECPCKILYYEKRMALKNDSKISGLFDEVLEGAPVFIIQVYIVLLAGSIRIEQIISMASSAIMIPYSIVRFNQPGGSYDDNPAEPYGNKATIAHFLWKFFEMVPRMVAFGALAVAVPGWGFSLAVAVNSGILIIWVLFCQKRTKEKEECVDPNPVWVKLYLVIMALASNFFFVHTQLTGDTRKSKLLYYIVVEVENALIVLAWILTQGMDHSFTVPIATLVIGSIVPKIISMLVFYLCFHPKHKKIRGSLKRGDQFPCCCRKSDESSAESALEMTNLETNQGIENMDDANIP